MYYLGFDVGTSALKTILINETGQIIYERNQGYSYCEPKDGSKEINPEIWFQAVFHELEHIIHCFRDEKVHTIGVTGQMHTTVFLDDEGQVLRPAIMWNDLRTKDMITSLRKELQKNSDTYEISKIISTGSPAVNILWMKRQEPQNFQKLGKVMTAYDYIVYRLTGEYSCDYCGASTSSLYNIKSKKWSEHMLNDIGIEERVLGKVHGSCDIIGNLAPKLCQLLGVESPIRVIAGTGDNPATAVAMGILKKRETVISLGTSGVVISPKPDGAFQGKGKNVLFFSGRKEDSVINICQGVEQAAGGAHKWWVESVVKTEDLMVDQTRIHDSDFGENSVKFYPHIAGDKTLYADANLRGAFLGLSTYTKREHMTQAVLEGVAYAFRELLEAVGGEKKQRIRISGGGTKSSLWMRIMANVLNREVEVVNGSASAGYGVCLLAAMSDRKKINENAIQEEPGTLYRPKAVYAEKYQKAYMEYRKIHDGIFDIR